MFYDSQNQPERAFVAKLLINSSNGALTVVADVQSGSSTGDVIGLIRMDTTGTLDPTFGQAGLLSVSINGNDAPSDAAMLSNGQMLVMAHNPHTPGQGNEVLRLNTDGSLDTTYATNGVFSTNFGDVLALQPGGSAILAGSVTVGWDAPSQLALERLTSQGMLDTTFGTNGTALVSVPANDVTVRSILRQTDGRIVVAAIAQGYNPPDTSGNANGPDTMALVRVTSDGVIDDSWGTHGVIFNQLPESTPGNLVQQADGKVILSAAVLSSLALIRYQTTLAAPAAGLLSFSAYSVQANYQDASVTVSVTRAGGSTGAVTVDYATADGTAIAGSAYTREAGTMHFAAGQTSATFTIPILPQLGLVPDRTIDLMLSNATGGALLDNPMTAIVTIAGNCAKVGTLDTTFGTNGTTTTDVGGSDTEVWATAIQPDGKILVVGKSSIDSSNSEFTVTRYNANGTLDATFANNGIALVDFGGGTAWGTSVALQSNGNIVVAGWVNLSNGNQKNAIGMIRLLPSGLIDRTFGQGGRVITFLSSPGGDLAMGLALQPDGKIVVVGQSKVVRYLPDGTLDQSFGQNGKVTPTVANGQINSVAIQPNGQIVVGYGQGVERLNSDGTMDTSFGNAGVAAGSFTGYKEEYFSQITVQPDGKIVEVGTVTDSASIDSLAVQRFNSSGTLDSTFGTSGLTTANFHNSSFSLNIFHPAAIVVHPDGRIIAAAVSYGSPYGYEVAAFTPSGALDPCFNGTGKLLGDTGQASDYSLGMALQNDGNIVVAADAYAGGKTVFSVTRYNGYPLQGWFQFTAAAQNVDGEAGTATINVERTGGAFGAATIAYAATAGTAVDGVDFQATSGTLHFADGQTEATFTISIPDNPSPGGDKTINLSLSNPSTGALLGTIPNSVLTIQNGPGQFQFHLKSYLIDENAGEAIVTVDRTSGSEGIATVDFATVPGSATPGLDYSSVTQTLTFGDGVNSQTIYVPVLNNPSPGGVVTVGLSLTNPTGGASLGTQASSTLSIYATQPGQGLNPGGLDPNYHNGTFATTNGAVVGQVFGMVIQPDGKRVVAGRANADANGFTEIALARFNPDGSLDATFGNGGSVITEIPGVQSGAQCVAQEADGSIVIAGDAIASGISRWVVERYTLSGTLDASFGSGGTVLTAINRADSRAYGIAVQSNGEILVTGSAGGAFTRYFATARYTTSGQLDASFGTGGIVTTSFGAFDEASSVLVQPDGQILVVGSSISSISAPYGYTGQLQTFPSGTFALVRYNTSGSIDTSFGTNGEVKTKFTLPTGFANQDQRANAVTLQPDGKIVVAGSDDGNFVVARYNTNGSLDTYFGSSGAALSSFHVGQQFTLPNDIAHSVVIQPDGRIVLIGSSNGEIALVRYLSDGTPDLDFGSYGQTTTGLSVSGVAGGFAGGAIVVAGTTYGGDFAVAQFLANTLAPLEGALQFRSSDFVYMETPGQPGTVSISVVRPWNQAYGAVTVDYSTVDNTATAGVDYTTTTGTLKFADGQTLATFTVPILGNPLFGGYKDIHLILANPTGGAILGSQHTADVTIEGPRANNPGQFDTYDTSADVSTGSATITVYRDSGNLGDVTIDFSTTDGTAVAGLDYTPVSGTLDFPDGVEQQSITIPLNSNVAYGADKTFTVTLTDPTGGARLGQTTAQVTLLNSFAANCPNAGTLDTTFGSGGMVTTDFGVKINEPQFAQDVAVQTDGKYVVVGRTGQTGPIAMARYNPNGSLDTTFGTGGKVTTALSPTGTNTANAVFLEGNKILIVGTAFFPGSEDFAIVRYNSDGSIDTTFGTQGHVLLPFAYFANALPQIVLQSDGKIVAAGQAFNGSDNDVAIVRLKTDGSLDSTFGSNGQVTYDFGYSDEWAVSLVLQNSRILLMTSGGDLMRFNTDGTIDNTFGTKGIQPLVFSTGSGSAGAMTVLANGKILVAGEYYDSNTGASGLGVGQLNPDGTADTTFGDGGIAINGSDVYGTATSIAVQNDGRIIVAGAAGGHFALARFNAIGTYDIGFGQSGLTITNFNGGSDQANSVVVLGSGNILAVGLVNNGGKQLFGLARYVGGDASGAFRLDAASYTVVENTPSLTVTVIRECGDDGTATVQFSTSDQSALANVDYTAVKTTLTFADGQRSATVTIPLAVVPSSQTFVGNRTFGISLSLPMGGAMLDPTANTAVVTIQGIRHPGQFAFAAPVFTDIETEGTATITVNRLSGSDGAVSVVAATSDGTAIAGMNYVATTQTLSFADGETSASFTVPLIHDPAATGDLTANLTLSQPTGQATIQTATSVLDILDADNPGALQYSAPTYQVKLSAGAATITVTRTVGVAGTVMVNYATSDGTAVANSDYTPESGTLSFAPGQTSASFTVPVLHNDLNLGNKTLNLTLTSAAGGATLGAQSTATLKIVNDLPNQPGEFQFSMATYTASSNDPFLSVTVDRVNGSQGTASVFYVTSDGTAVSGVDYVTTAGQLTFLPGQTSTTFTALLLDNAHSTASQLGFNLQLIAFPSGLGTLGTPSTATVTINEQPRTVYPGAFQFVQDAYAATPSNGLVPVTIIRAGGADGTTTVHFATSDGTGQAGVDYADASQTVSFAANQNKTTVLVPLLTPSAGATGTRTVNLALTDPTGGAGARHNRARRDHDLGV